MDFSKTDAITLRKTDYKNSSQIVIFYVRDYGKIQVLVKRSKTFFEGPKRRNLFTDA